MKNAPAQALLKELFDYDPEVGVFVRRVSTSNSVKVGDVAGYLGKDGYLQFCVGGRLYRAHQLAWIYIHGSPPAGYIDHINGNRSDNRISNLRLATASENAANSKLPSHNHSSGIKGVTWFKPIGKWMAHITVKQKFVCLGYFESKEDAAKARKLAADETFGAFARH